jgi:hypothetical protein
MVFWISSITGFLSIIGFAAWATPARPIGLSTRMAARSLFSIPAGHWTRILTVALLTACSSWVICFRVLTTPEASDARTLRSW